MKSYTDIPRLGHKTTIDYLNSVASKKLNIKIYYKYDGSNGQFDVNEQGEISVYSRRTELSDEIDLGGGFYRYVKDKVDPARLPKNVKVFGEWLAKHKIVYPADMYHQFYLFDVYDTVKEEYLSPDSEVFKQVEDYIVGELGMKKAEVIYDGPYLGMDHINEILKRVTKEGETYDRKIPTTFEEVFHEGIVIKCHEYRDQFDNQMFVKIVGERFKEIKKVKYTDKVKGPDNSVEGKIAEFAVTEARVEKIMYKFIDEGVLPEVLDLEHMNLVARNVPKRVFEDIMNEELDTILDEFGEFDRKVIGKKIGSATIKLAKDIINQKINERLKEF